MLRRSNSFYISFFVKKKKKAEFVSALRRPSSIFKQICALIFKPLDSTFYDCKNFTINSKNIRKISKFLQDFHTSTDDIQSGQKIFNFYWVKVIKIKNKKSSGTAADAEFVSVPASEVGDDARCQAGSNQLKSCENPARGVPLLNSNNIFKRFK